MRLSMPRRVIQRGLLMFTRNVLNLPVLGGARLVHAMIALTGISFASAIMCNWAVAVCPKVTDDSLSPTFLCFPLQCSMRGAHVPPSNRLPEQQGLAAQRTHDAAEQQVAA